MNRRAHNLPTITVSETVPLEKNFSNQTIKLIILSTIPFTLRGSKNNMKVIMIKK